MEGVPWHALPVEEALARLESSSEGLAGEEARRRLEGCGPNAIRAARRAAPVALLLAQFTSPLIAILLVAAGISFAMGHSTDGWVILTIVILNALIGFFQEYKAERALAALSALAAPGATVLRDGRPAEIAAVDLVPGDVVLLAAGDRVPADARVLEAANLQVEEAALTGESASVRKHRGPVVPDAPLAERESMLFLGTAVATGRGRAVVTATGMGTEMGAIAREVESAGDGETRRQPNLAGLGGGVGGAAGWGGVARGAAGALHGLPWADLFFTGVAAAVSFIPEGLPAVVTAVLAVGVQRMVRRRAIIRRLPAVETLGSATFICTDKTGTLTKNEMTVRALWLPGATVMVEGEGYAPEGGFRAGGEPVEPARVPGLELLMRAGALCSDAHLSEEDGRWRVSGDPTEGALLVAARKAGLQEDNLAETYPRVAEIPFDSDQRYMATLHAGPDDERWLFVKGAPERVLGMSGRLYLPDDPQGRPLSDAERDGVRKANEHLAGQALRVLGLAVRRLPPGVDAIEPDSLEGDLLFLGLVGMIDPPRPEAERAVDAARRAGIRVMMITGDHRITARAIAGQLGLLRDGGEVLEGRDIAALSDEELERRVEGIAACARAEPAHKLRIVKALQKRGHVVAMTGDGVNDAPALKRADIGVAMGITGTDVSREASDMVLADDNFATLVGAVQEGRVIFSNIRRVVVYLLATNSGEALTLLLTILAGFPLPLLPVQILWINLITDGAPTIALGQEPAHAGVLDEPPRDPRAPFLQRALLYRVVFVALFMAAGTMGLFLFALRGGSLEHARTVAFATMATFQLFNVWNARSLNESVFRVGLLRNRWVVWGVLSSALLLVAAIHVGFLQRALGTTPLSLADWAAVVLVSSAVLVAEEIRKAVAPGVFGVESVRAHRTPVRAG